MRRRRTLSAEDKLLWWHVTRAVTPFKNDAERIADVVPLSEPQVPSVAAPQPLLKPAKIKPALPRDELEVRLKRKVVRGTQEIEARLDLHGMRQEEAHRTLMQFLRQSQALSRRVVIVITGKGKPEKAMKVHDEPWHFNPYDERGVLRRLVPQWLKLPEFHPYVVGFEKAGRGHGGEGALYVHIRRLRERSL